MARVSGAVICYVNGNFVQAEEAVVSIFDRGLMFGDSVYEVMRVERSAVFRLADHLERMLGGLQALRIAPPFSAEEFARICSELVRRNAVEQGLVYIQVTRGAAPRGHLIPSGIRPTMFAYAISAAMPSWAAWPNGVHVITAPDERWRRCCVKTTMLLPNVLAKQAAFEAGAYEALLISEDGFVREGASSNVFAVVGGVLRTPPADERILSGVTRKVVLELAAACGISLVEDCLSLEELMGAEEVFLTSTTNDVCPVVRVNGRSIGTGAIGPVTRRLMDQFARCLTAASCPAPISV